MKGLKGDLLVGTADPGGKRDSFFFVLLRVNQQERKIYIIGGHEWKFVDNQIAYPEIERDLATINDTRNLDFFVVEQNNTGIHVIQTMKNQYHIPIVAVKTSGQLKERGVILKGDTMDKTEHVGWINFMRQEKRLLISKNVTPGIRKIILQLDSFVRVRTPGGKITYQAQGEQADDAVMALMVGTHFIRRKIFGEMGVRKHHTAFKKYNTREISRHLKSAIPSDMKLAGRSVVMPSGGTGYGSFRIH